jgi:hypothetical protein
MITRKFAKDVTAKIEHGAWVKGIPNLPGLALKVRGIGNSDYRRLLMKLRADLSPDEIADEKKQAEMDARLMQETILVGWDGMEDPFTPEHVKTWLTDPELAVFRSGVVYAASTVAQDGRESLEADAKN